jgi:hypothetical protein
MKRPTLASSRLVFACLLASAFLVTACGDDDGGDGGTGTDGSVPGTDGGVVVLDDGRVIGPDACVPTFEICGDRMDQNCDGMEDACGNTDGDFFDACREGQAPPACDCNDRVATIYPGAPETCNGIDDDCDGRADEIASCCAACTGMVERADSCTPAGVCVCSTEGAGDAPCAVGQACCSSGCADLQSDFANCGLCNAGCTNQADHCSAGLCMCGSGPACDKAVMCSGGSC